jgi:vanillate O-demethylase monooxygenase subunit
MKAKAAMFPRNQWYAFGWDYEVGREPVGRRICNEPIVAYRRTDGVAVALEDACPHRLLPMSAGRVEGDNIRCGYHGLLMNERGETVEMPGGDPPRPHICGKPYPIVEKHRFLWVWIGEAARADESLIPDMGINTETGWRADGGTYPVKCDYRLLIDNLMDLTHETYVHASSIGQAEIHDFPIETQTDGDVVTCTRWMPNIPPAPLYKARLPANVGNVDRWQICKFIAPCAIVIDIGVAPVEEKQTLEDHDKWRRSYVINLITPETDKSCWYFWGATRKDTGDEDIAKRVKGQGAVFQEDVEILEAQQRSIDAFPDRKLRSFSIDAGGVHARVVLERMLKRQA